MKKIPVVICGAGPVGLSLALALGQQGIENVVIEKHPGITIHPKARGVNVRTMELFRHWGIEDAVRAHELPAHARRLLWMESLQGQCVGAVNIEAPSSEDSPATACFVTQDFVEQELLAAVRKQKSCQVQFSTCLTALQQHTDYVDCTVNHRETDTAEHIRCQYLVAADGAHSTIREQLNIAMNGIADMGQYLSVYCRVALPSHFVAHPAIVTVFTNPEQRGKFVMAVDLKKKWIVAQRTEGTKTSYDEARCMQLVRDVAGVSGLPVDIINISTWQMAALHAEQYQIHRVFLAGDAAHRIPPTGGMGMNTGIQDAHNLAWKLAYVLRHHAPPALLDSYHEERQPVAAYTMDWSCRNAERLSNVMQAVADKDSEQFEKALMLQKAQLNHRGLDLGFTYQSGAIYSPDSDMATPVVHDPDIYYPSSSPGARAPHCVIEMNGKRLSTLDLFRDTFVLLLARNEPVDHLLARLPIPRQYPCVVYQWNTHFRDIDDNFISLYEMTDHSAVLVRPDGHVAWRL